MPIKINSSTLSQIPIGVWMLGFVSLLMDVSSEMIRSLLPLFMVTVLGASALAVGVIESIAESTALLVKIFSGVLSDYLGKRKGLAIFGYALGALTKPILAMASGVGMVLTARFLDRVGKDVRGVPRDALIADITPVEIRGTAYGFFNLMSGLAMLLASVVAGLLWDRLGASFTFYTGAVFCVVTLVSLLLRANRLSLK